jgi:hypothetical protein
VARRQDADGTVYLVLEPLQGEELAHLLQRKGRLPPEEALALLALRRQP